MTKQPSVIGRNIEADKARFTRLDSPCSPVVWTGAREHGPQTRVKRNVIEPPMALETGKHSKSSNFSEGDAACVKRRSLCPAFYQQACVDIKVVITSQMFADTVLLRSDGKQTFLETAESFSKSAFKNSNIHYPDNT